MIHRGNLKEEKKKAEGNTLWSILIEILASLSRKSPERDLLLTEQSSWPLAMYFIIQQFTPKTNTVLYINYYVLTGFSSECTDI